MREGDRVWLADRDGRLDIRTVEVFSRGREEILVGGLAEGDRVVVSRLRSPVPGMALRVRAPEGDEVSAGEAPEGGAGR